MEEVFCNEVVHYLLPKDQNALMQVDKALYLRLKEFVPTLPMIKLKEKVEQELFRVTSCFADSLTLGFVGEAPSITRFVKIGEPYLVDEEEVKTVWQDYKLNSGEIMTFDYYYYHLNSFWNFQPMII